MCDYARRSSVLYQGGQQQCPHAKHVPTAVFGKLRGPDTFSQASSTWFMTWSYPQILHEMLLPKYYRQNSYQQNSFLFFSGWSIHFYEVFLKVFLATMRKGLRPICFQLKLSRFPNVSVPLTDLVSFWSLVFSQSANASHPGFLYAGWRLVSPACCAKQGWWSDVSSVNLLALLYAI